MKNKKITLGYIKIKEKQGANYAKDSGDKNKIHVDKIYGYNSIFGRNIVHGTLIISKFLKSPISGTIILVIMIYVLIITQFYLFSAM